jgi:methyl-accepting chemotaxis protein
VTANGDRRFEKILQGIQYLIRDNELLREDLREYARRADEDRKQAAEDRKQAAEDRRRMNELLQDTNEIVQGIRKALVVIGKRGADFVEMIRKQTEAIKEQGRTLERIEQKIATLGRRNGNGPR